MGGNSEFDIFDFLVNWQQLYIWKLCDETVANRAKLEDESQRIAQSRTVLISRGIATAAFDETLRLNQAERENDRQQLLAGQQEFLHAKNWLRKHHPRLLEHLPSVDLLKPISQEQQMQAITQLKRLEGLLLVASASKSPDKPSNAAKKKPHSKEKKVSGAAKDYDRKLKIVEAWREHHFSSSGYCPTAIKPGMLAKASKVERTTMRRTIDGMFKMPKGEGWKAYERLCESEQAFDRWLDMIIGKIPDDPRFIRSLFAMIALPPGRAD